MGSKIGTYAGDKRPKKQQTRGRNSVRALLGNRNLDGHIANNPHAGKRSKGPKRQRKKKR